MFIFVKKVDGRWKIAVATIDEVENHQVDWASDEFSRTTFWTKNAGEAFIVAAKCILSKRRWGNWHHSTGGHRRMKCFECRQTIMLGEERVPDNNGRTYCSQECLEKRRDKNESSR